MRRSLGPLRQPFPAPLVRVLPLIVLGFTALATAVRGDDATDPAALRAFEQTVRPVLIENCQGCHGPEKAKAGLRVDSRAGLLEGGESGPAIVPGDPGASLIVEAIHHDGLRMPPKGKLPADQIRALELWIEQGAPWPESGASGTPTTTGPRPVREPFTAADRSHWSFQPLRPVAPPAQAISGWSDHPIDRFLGAGLAAQGLTPAPEASRRTLIRRLSLDLIGLPPSPEEIAAFEADPAPDAYDRLVDRLLASDRYGERWARHWLDLVRFAESDGYRADEFRPQAWRYRDWVIAAFNSDLPYDRFVTEQLAGDELDPADPTKRIPTQFLRLGTYEFNQRDVPSQWSTILNDLTDVTGDVFLGLGLACARCHDHKFDPILQRDYYRLQAFFTPLIPRDDLPQATDAERADHAVRRAAWELMTADLRAERAAIEAPHRAAARADALAKFQPELQAILQKPVGERTPQERQFAYLMERQLIEEFGRIDGRIQGEERKRVEALQQQIAAFDFAKPKDLPVAFTATDVGPEAPATVIPGDRRRQAIEPGFLSLLDPTPAAVPTPPHGTTTGRRLALAQWLTRPDHPLTTRVIVNRVWQQHFGRGLVATASDYGRLGEAPTHPELLDWLARQFVAEGWRLKSLHRLIVTSKAYRQASVRPAKELAYGQSIDPENRLLWHQGTRRREAEQIRDAMLFASGELDLTAGGPSVGADKPRRSIYTKQIRNTHDPLLDAFDAPDGSASVALRNTTTTPTQSLLLINGKWTLERARALADRVRREATDDPARIDRAYALTLGRPPSPDVRQEALAFLHPTGRAAPAVAAVGAEVECEPGAAQPTGNTPTPASTPEAWVDFCHALLNANAFLYDD